MIHFSRRRFLEAGVAGASASLMPSTGFSAASRTGSQQADDAPILVVVELSGGNDGLNSVVPHGDDAYYRHRPTIGIAKKDLLLIDNRYGFNPGMLGFDRLWKDNNLAIVHGCGYEQPSYSHFTSMAYWHTASPNGGDEFGWVGRLADALAPNPTPNYLINIGSAQSLAVKSRLHTPVVFDDPKRFQRSLMHRQRQFLDEREPPPVTSSAQRYVNDVSRSARQASLLVQRAWSDYQSPVDYGIAPLDLPKVAACIEHGLPTQLYYVAFRNNAFDTHVQQPALHRRLLSYACDGIHGFLKDMERIGQAHRVVVLAFSEFGRRVGENANLGTDHGSANTMFVAGAPVRGGHHGAAPDLDRLTPDDNLVHTVDFRRVYASVIDGWLAQKGDAGGALSQRVLKGVFEPLALFEGMV